MNRAIVIGVVAVLVIGVAGVAGLILLDGDTGFGGAESAPSGSEPGGDEPDDDGAASSTTPDMEMTEASFQFTVDEIVECGNTCRDVTATLENDGNETAGSVVVETTIYTDGDEIWTGEESVGTLDPDDAHTTTRRVDLSFRDALKVDRNDGWITIETVVRFDEGTEVFTEERQVS